MYLIKKRLRLALEQRIMQRSTLGVAVIGIICVIFYKEIHTVLKDYIQSPEFRGVLEGSVVSLMTYFFGKKG